MHTCILKSTKNKQQHFKRARQKLEQHPLNSSTGFWNSDPINQSSLSNVLASMKSAPDSLTTTGSLNGTCHATAVKIIQHEYLGDVLIICGWQRQLTVLG